MPILFRIKNIVFYFYSSEHLPIHLHIRAGEKRAKIEVETGKVNYNKGFNAKDIKLFQMFIKKEQPFIKESWNEYFKTTR